MDPFSCQVVFKRPEITTEKTSMIVGRWNCQVIQANREERQDQEQNGSALWPAKWKTSENLVNKGNIVFKYELDVFHMILNCG